jgi:hypothetical protein
VLRGIYKQLAAKGLVSWETAQDIAAIQALFRPSSRNIPLSRLDPCHVVMNLGRQRFFHDSMGMVREALSRFLTGLADF